MKKWIPTISAIVSAVLVVVSPQLQAVIVAHPEVSAVLSMLYVILAHVLPSPLQSR